MIILYYVIINLSEMCTSILAKEHNTKELFWTTLENPDVLYFRHIKYAERFIEKMKINEDTIYEESSTNIKIAKIDLKIDLKY